MSPLNQHEEDDVLQETIAILNCLEYLRREALSSGLDDAARFIALAADSVHRTISDDGDGPDFGGGLTGMARSGLH